MLIWASSAMTRNKGRMGDSGQERVLRVFDPVLNILLSFACGERLEERIVDASMS